MPLKRIKFHSFFFLKQQPGFFFVLYHILEFELFN